MWSQGDRKRLFGGILWGGELLGSRLNLLGSHVANVLGDRPFVTERVDDPAVPVTPEHVGQRHLDTRAGVDGPLKGPLGIVGPQVQGHRSPVEGLW